MVEYRRLFEIVFSAILATYGGSVRADGASEPIPSYYQEPGKSPSRDYANQHPSEHIDPFSGKLQWHYVDLFIPGNGGFDLKVQRSYSSQSEAFPANSSTGVGWTMHFGRVLRGANLALCDTTSQGANAKANPVLELPDGSRQILYLAPDNISYITPRFWKGVCTAGSLAVFSPEGTRYDMNFAGADEGSGPFPIHTYYVSRITDRNNNFMTLNYVNLGVATGVTSVTTSDGRALTFNYSGGSLTSISDGSRTWTYAYQASSAMLGQNYLKSVQPPDGPAWTYDYYDSAVGTPGAASMKTVTYPTGGTITYAYDFVTFSVSAFLLPRSTVVKTKTSSDGGTWNFTYKPATESIPDGATSFAALDPAKLDVTTITGPGGTRVYSHIGYTTATSGWVWAIGLQVQIATGGVQAEGFSWAPSVISNQVNLRPGGTLTSDPVTAAPVSIGHGTNRDGQLHDVAFGALDEFGNPGVITETGTEQKETTVTYAVDTGRWILHLKKDESSRNLTTGESVGAITRTFDANSNLTSETRYGVPTTFTYTPQGDVASKKDARNNTSSFSSYVRGTPQSETHPESVLIARVVDAGGNVTAQTDGENATTRYAYDRLNRLTGITHPVANPVTVVWTANTRKVTRGTYIELLTFDGFGRQVREEHQGAAATIFQTSRYDAAGRATFKSYPNTASGTTFTFDDLARVKTTSHPASTGGTAGRTYLYRNNQTVVQNERGNVSTYTYRVFGDAEHRDLIQIDAPESSASVAIKRNTLGQMVQVTQEGRVRAYQYDAHFFLITKSDPETGNTVYGRDAIGNMTTRSVGSSATTGFSYDNLNRLAVTTHPSGPTVTRSYFRDDKLKSVDTGLALLAYVYDTNKNLTQERLTIGTQVFTTSYAYNANDALSVLTYGSGKTVSYAPDALGRPTQAAPYVTGVAYHPTGQISGITYANGVTTAVALNARLWPSTMSTGRPGSPIFDMSYGYDENGNVLSITNTTDVSYNRSMAYDNIDRMTQANGSWGAGTFTYDGRGNLKTQQLGGFGLTYTYAGSEQLASVTGSKAYAFTYDAYGNVTGNGSTTFAYNDASNMRCARCGQPDESQFDYDGLNLRVRQVKSGVTTYFVYGLDGKLLWEKTPLVNIKEYVYLGGKQVATREQPISTP